MTEQTPDLRERVTEALRPYLFGPDWNELRATDAVMAVVSPEVARLRAEVGRLDQANEGLGAALVEARDENQRLRAALTYISAPTMGLPSGVDAAEFVTGAAPSSAVRLALQNCILQARAALAAGDTVATDD